MVKRFDPAASHPRPMPQPRREAGGFAPMDEVMREMGLAAPEARAEAPLVAPHGPEAAEFQPPRPLRRAATRFAHLRPEDRD